MYTVFQNVLRVYGLWSTFFYKSVFVFMFLPLKKIKEEWFCYLNIAGPNQTLKILIS